jgi:transposase
LGEGQQDRRISRILSEELQRSASSIDGKIRRLVRSGELLENPNKQQDFTPEEIATIKRRRNELMGEGQQDTQISRILSEELQRSAGSINSKIRQLVRSGELLKNPNKTQDFTTDEIETIKRRRNELMGKGETDNHISAVISKELKRSAGSINNKIHRLVKSGELPKNPNKQTKQDFTPEEIETIKRRRNELMGEGQQDKQISRILSEELQRSASSINNKIRRLVKSGELQENPNKRITRPKLSEDELSTQLEEAVGLYLGVESERDQNSDVVVN